MKQRAERLDVFRSKLIEHPQVEIDTRLVWLARAFGKDARPGDREAVNLRAEIGEQLDIFAITMIVVIGHVPGLAVVSRAGLMRKRVPDRGAAAALPRASFDLVGGGRAAPAEAVRKPVELRIRHAAGI